MIWNIVADSSGDVFDKTIKEGDTVINIYTVPLTLSVDKRDFVDDEKLDVNEYLDAVEGYDGVSRTSCPAPGLWLEKFEMEGNCIAVTISKNVSGCYASALTAKNMVEDKPVTIISLSLFSIFLSILSFTLFKILFSIFSI